MHCVARCDETLSRFIPHAKQCVACLSPAPAAIVVRSSKCWLHFSRRRLRAEPTSRSKQSLSEGRRNLPRPICDARPAGGGLQHRSLERGNVSGYRPCPTSGVDHSTRARAAQLGGGRPFDAAVVNVRDRRPPSALASRRDGASISRHPRRGGALAKLAFHRRKVASRRWRSASEQRRASLSVLVVDDDYASREAAAKPFRDRGDVVRHRCSDGVEALRRACPGLYPPM